MRKVRCMLTFHQCMQPTLESDKVTVAVFSMLAIVAVLSLDSNIVCLSNSHWKHQLSMHKFSHSWSQHTATIITWQYLWSNSDNITRDETFIITYTSCQWQVPMHCDVESSVSVIQSADNRKSGGDGGPVGKFGKFTLLIIACCIYRMMQCVQYAPHKSYNQPGLSKIMYKR